MDFIYCLILLKLTKKKHKVIHLNIIVKGTVQGVYFRASTRLKALELGIKGYVENRADGSVYIEAEGTKAQLKKFTDWCSNGPEHAFVEEIDEQEAPLINYMDFIIKR